MCLRDGRTDPILKVGVMRLIHARPTELGSHGGDLLVLITYGHRPRAGRRSGSWSHASYAPSIQPITRERSRLATEKASFLLAEFLVGQNSRVAEFGEFA